MSVTKVQEPKEITLDYIDYVVTKGIQMGIVNKDAVNEWRKSLS